MRALDTEYHGFRFRSRLEARWAVFMDAMDIPYLYEPEAFDLNGLLYLPDFHILSMDAFLEIKAVGPNEEECLKAERLAEHTGKPVYVLFGQPGEDATFHHCDSGWKCEFCFESYDLAGEVMAPHAWWDYSYVWCECPHCGRCEIQFSGRADRIDCKCPKSEHGDKGYNSDSKRLLAAYSRAKSYRFEPRAINGA